MTPKFRMLALGCAAAALFGSAQASVVTLDFETIGIAAPLAGTPVGSIFTADYGVTFSANAIANHSGLGPPNSVSRPFARPADNNFGFVRNGVDSTTGFTVSFASTTNYSDISLDWSAVANFTVTVYDLAGHSRTSSQGGSNFASWNSLDLTSMFGDQRRIDSIDFSSNVHKRFAIDNLQLTVVTVTEPAGLGLVALALAGAGLASRRRSKV